MIEPWLLPGPRALTAAIAEDLVEGRQLILTASGQAEPLALRHALTATLAFSQVSVSALYDVPTVPPDRLLAQASSAGVARRGEAMPGVYWVEDMSATRSEAWFGALAQLEEQERNTPPLLRCRLVLPVSGAAKAPQGLGIRRRSLDALGLIDLEVAARYHGTVAAAPAGPLARLRSALAVQLARGALPRLEALQVLAHPIHRR